jgi:hypothetical protein
MKKNHLIVSILLIFTIFTACDILDQARQVAMLSKCEFKLKTVDQLKLAGVNIQQIKKLSDLSLTDAAKITTAATLGSKLPLNFTLNVEIKNPNTTAAAMTKLDWILLIDDIQMVSGMNEQRIQVPANGGTAVLPLSIGIDLKQALKGKSADAIANFGLNLAGAGNKPTRITLKAKPYIQVGGQSISYPGYLTVQNEFTSN